MKPAIYAYIRWSTDEQANGDSERRQRDGERAYAARQDWTISDEAIVVDGGVSAYTGENVTRGRLGGLLEQARNGKLRGSVLIVEDLDRFSRRRNFREGPKILNAFMDGGVTIHEWSKNRIYDPETFDLTDYILAGVTQARASEESARKAERVAAAWANKRANASTKPLTAKCPGWLKLVDGEYVKIDNRAEIVKQIFEQSAAGVGTWTISRDLNERKIPSFGSGREWHESYLKKILDNRAVIGEVQFYRKVNGKRVPDGEPRKDYYPRVVSDQLFFRAKQSRAQRLIGDKNIGAGGRKGENISNLFSGVAFCSYCTSKMRYINKGSGNTYLVCSKALRGLGCERTGWSYPDFEKTFVDYVKDMPIVDIINADTQQQKSVAIQNEIEGLKGKIIEHNEKLELYDEALKKQNSDFITQKMFEREQQLKDDKALLEKKEHELESVSHELKDFRELQGESVRHLLQDYKKRAHYASRLKTLVDRVIIAPVGSAPFAKFKSWFVVGEKRTEAKLNPKIDFKNHPGMHQPWFAIFLHDVKETQVYGAPGTVVVSE